MFSARSYASRIPLGSRAVMAAPAARCNSVVHSTAPTCRSQSVNDRSRTGCGMELRRYDSYSPKGICPAMAPLVFAPARDGRRGGPGFGRGRR